MDHFKHLCRTLQAGEQCIVERSANGARLLVENPFECLVGKKGVFKFVVFEEIIEKLPPPGFGDQQQRIVMTGAGNLHKLAVRLGQGHGANRFELFFIRILLHPEKALQDGGGLVVPLVLQLSPVQTPYGFVTFTRVRIGVLFETFQQIV